MGISCRDLALGTDVACTGECNLGKEGSNKLVDKHRKEGDACYDGVLRLKRHAECNSRLGKKGYTEILDSLLVTAHEACAYACTEVFARRAGKDINYTDKDNHALLEYAEVKLCTAYYEEENKYGSSPSVGSVHKLLGKVAYVAEHGTEHHTGKERGEADVNSADGGGKRGKSNREHYEGNRNRHTLASGVEEALHIGEQNSHNKAECKREHYLKERLKDDLKELYRLGAERARYTEGNSEHNKSDRIVDCNDGKKEVGELTLCLILLYYHKGSGRSGSSSYGTEYKSGRERKLICTDDKVQSDKECINNNRSENSLEDTDNGSLLSYLFKSRDTELVTHRKGDEAESDLRDEAEALYLREIVEAESLNAECTEAEGADNNSRNKICGYGRETYKLCKSGKKESSEEGSGQTNKYGSVRHRRFL